MTKEEFLAMSLPYRILICIDEMSGYTNLKTIEIENDVMLFEGFITEYVKPILRPLSMLTEPCLPDGKVPIEVITGKNNDLNYLIIKDRVNNGKLSISNSLKLVEWHFDIAGLIEKGEAIAVTEDFNPYK